MKSIKGTCQVCNEEVKFDVDMKNRIVRCPECSTEWNFHQVVTE